MGRGEVDENGGEVHVPQEQVEREKEDGQHDLKPGKQRSNFEYAYTVKRINLFSLICGKYEFFHF